MTPDREKLALKPCPFCNAQPHQGPTKVRHCSLHGDPLQDYRIWCPHQCASILRPNRERAIESWNTRAPLAETAPSGEVVKHPLPWRWKVEPQSYPECDDCDMPAVIRDANGVEVIAIYERYGPHLEAQHEEVAAFIVEKANAHPAPTPSASEDQAAGNFHRIASEAVLPFVRHDETCLVAHEGETAPCSCGARVTLQEFNRARTDVASALALRDETIARLTALCDRLKMEAQGHRMEARGANDSLHKAYQACTGGKGEPGNWNGAEPVKRTVEELRSTVSALEARLAVMGEALRLAGDWLSCVEPHLRDSADFKRHRETIRAALTDGERDGD